MRNIYADSDCILGIFGSMYHDRMLSDFGLGVLQMLADEGKFDGPNPETHFQSQDLPPVVYLSKKGWIRRYYNNDLLIEIARAPLDEDALDLKPRPLGLPNQPEWAPTLGLRVSAALTLLAIEEKDADVLLPGCTTKLQDDLVRILARYPVLMHPMVAVPVTMNSQKASVASALMSSRYAQVPWSGSGLPVSDVRAFSNNPIVRLGLLHKTDPAVFDNPEPKPTEVSSAKDKLMSAIKGFRGFNSRSHIYGSLFDMALQGDHAQELSPVNWSREADGHEAHLRKIYAAALLDSSQPESLRCKPVLDQPQLMSAIREKVNLAKFSVSMANGCYSKCDFAGDICAFTLDHLVSHGICDARTGAQALLLGLTARSNDAIVDSITHQALDRLYEAAGGCEAILEAAAAQNLAKEISPQYMAKIQTRRNREVMESILGDSCADSADNTQASRRRRAAI